MKTKFSINLALLGFVFIALKVFGIVTWSWFWVLSPFWISVILFVMMWGLINIMAAIFLIALKTGNVTLSKNTKS